MSKKLLEVTPEALERRRLGAGKYFTTPDVNTDADAEHENPCRRRLTKMSDEGGRRLGITACADFEGGTSSSFEVSLGRAANKESEHEHSVAISLKDGNAQDVFAVKILQDATYGTPIFTTMGGRSSCPGETATTRRDSRVTIKEIKPLCVSDADIKEQADSGEALCKSKLTCECKDLEPGQDAIISVVLQNLSPWVTSVRYLLRAVNGASTAWDSGKYARLVEEACPPGDLGSLLINPLGSDSGDLRNGAGEELAPLPYGQSEIRLLVSRRDFTPQCRSYTDLELELVAVCEDTDWADNQDVYQYQAHMDPDTNEVSVVHPKFVGRPVSGTKNTNVDITNNPSFSTLGSDKGWCYSDLNLAMGTTNSAAECWAACSKKVKDLEELHEQHIFPVLNNKEVTDNCPAAFVKQKDPETVICDVGELKAADWEELKNGNENSGQCRCQNSCDCLVEDYYVEDPITKTRTRQTTTHLLTNENLPEDDNETPVYCGLYTFIDASRANGPDTSRATFDVSWKDEVYGCRYEDAANFNPLATKDDGSCMFRIPGCAYAAAGNYNPDATEDDGSCLFGSQFAPRDVSGGSCMAGVDDRDALVALYRNMIAKLAGVDPSDVKVDVTEVSSCGGNGRRRLSGAFEFSYTITTNPADTDAVQATMAGVTAEDIDAELKSQAAQDGVDLGGATTEGVQEVTADSSSGGGSSAGNNKLEADSAEGSGLAVGAILLLFLIVGAIYVYRWCEAQKAQKAEQDDRLREALRRATPGFRRQEERISCAAAEDANHDSNREDSESEGDLEKQPLRPDSGGLELQDMSKPTAYPGGQSLPPWPYPETRPTPASYDPACILRVSWPRDAARPTESFLRETFEALAPVRNVGLGSGNAAMVVFKDAAGMRAAEAAYDGPWRTAPAKPPAAAADQPPPPPPPPKTGEV